MKASPMTSPLLLAAAAAALTLAACSTTPPRNTELEEARVMYEQARGHPFADRAAAVEMTRARQALARAESGWADDRDAERTRHEATLARRQAEIALAVATQAASESRIREASAERDRLQLEARTREADRATQQARSAQAAARSSQGQADLALQQADEARRQATMEAERAAALERDLQSMQARSTQRGLVVTLGDVLFATGRAELQPGALRGVERIAQVLKQYPERRVLVEGFTDATGSDSANLELSQRRADAFAGALAAQGIERQRIEVRAHGEAFPVADNATPAGRQQNRRVEILFSDAQGRIAPR
jgi:outer membrane protein OmpA-like peptidoglycan-associated protein